LINEPTPRVETEADLIEYAEHVRTEVQLNALFDEWEIDELQVKMDLEGWWREQRKAHKRLQSKMNSRSALKTAHKESAARSRRQGAETRKEVARWTTRASQLGLPEREQATWIAEQMGITGRHVRRGLASNNEMDKRTSSIMDVRFEDYTSFP
jgi:hypothetical protein